MTITKQCRGSWYLFFIERSAFTRIGIFAGGILLQSTEKTVATSNDERNYHSVAFLQIFYVLSGFNYFPHKFMTKNIAMFNLGYFASIKMEVRATDRRCRNTQNNIICLFNARIGNIFYLNVMWAVISQCFHATSRDSSKKSQSLRVAITAGKRAVPQVLGEFLVFSENILITETGRKEKEPDKYQG